MDLLVSDGAVVLEHVVVGGPGSCYELLHRGLFAMAKRVSLPLHGISRCELGMGWMEGGAHQDVGEVVIGDIDKLGAVVLGDDQL